MLTQHAQALYMLAGPTAVGKSAVAHHLAQKHQAAILSVDSMQVYRGMDIGTAKPTTSEQREVAYGGIDLVQVDQAFDLAQYVHQSRQWFDQHVSHHPLIATGGTGLYFNALIYGLGGELGSTEGRDELEQILQSQGVGALQQMLQIADPEWYAELADKENPRRLIRALEQSGSGESPDRSWKGQSHVPMVVLHMERAALIRRIEQRIDRMFEQGLIEEVSALKRQFPEWSDSALQSIGYKEILDLLSGACSEAEAREKILIRTRRLAKRQMTWFRHQGVVEWVEVQPDEPVGSIAERVEALWLKYGPTGIQV